MILTENQNELAIWFAIKMGLPKPAPMTYLGCRIGGDLVAVNGYEKFNGASMYIHMASNGKSRVTRDFIWAAFDFPFNHCKAQMLIGPVASTNVKALRLTKHLGFKIEHTIKGAHPDGDLVYTTMRREECRFLDRNWGRSGRL